MRYIDPSDAARAARFRRATPFLLGASADGEVVCTSAIIWALLEADDEQGRDPGRARHRVPRRAYGRGGRRGRLQRARLRALSQRQRGALAADRAGAPAEHQAGGDRRGQSRVRGGRLHGGGVRRPGRAHRRSRWCARSTMRRCASSTRAWPPPRTWTSPAGSASAIATGRSSGSSAAGLPTITT